MTLAKLNSRNNDKIVDAMFNHGGSTKQKYWQAVKNLDIAQNAKTFLCSLLHRAIHAFCESGSMFSFKRLFDVFI